MEGRVPAYANVSQDAGNGLRRAQPLTEDTLDPVEDSVRHLLIFPRLAEQDGLLCLLSLI